MLKEKVSEQCPLFIHLPILGLCFSCWNEVLFQGSSSGQACR